MIMSNHKAFSGLTIQCTITAEAELEVELGETRAWGNKSSASAVIVQPLKNLGGTCTITKEAELSLPQALVSSCM